MGNQWIRFKEAKEDFGRLTCIKSFSVILVMDPGSLNIGGGVIIREEKT